MEGELQPGKEQNGFFPVSQDENRGKRQGMSSLQQEPRRRRAENNKLPWEKKKNEKWVEKCGRARGSQGLLSLQLTSASCRLGVLGWGKWATKKERGESWESWEEVGKDLSKRDILSFHQ